MTARSSSRLVGLLAVLVLGLVGWLVVSLSSRDARPRHDSAIASAESEAKESPRLDGGTALVVDKQLEKEPTRAQAERLAVDEGPTQAELTSAVWVSGRVQLPENTPSDEKVTVVAAGKEFGSKKLHRVPVESDGTFKVAFAPSTKKAALRLEGRYVFLEESKALKLDEARSEIVLAPVLGGGLRGRVKLDPSAQGLAASLVGAPVETTGWKPGLSNSRRKSAKLASDLTFEIGGLDPTISWRVACTAKGFASVVVESANVTAGKYEPVELALERGASLSGIVRDEQGKPVEGAQIHSDARERGVSMEVRLDPVTDKEGRFTFADLRSGEAQIVVSAKGFTLGRHAPVKLEAGREQPIEVTLERGLSISGSARFGDGTVAADVTVTADPDDEESLPHGVWFDREDKSVKTDAQGNFTITGLVEGKHTVTARSAPRGVENASPGTKRAPRSRYEDSREGVAAGTNGLALTLESGVTLTGRVVDDTGAPVANYALVLERRGSRPWETTLRREALSKGKDGAFSIPGVGEGTWGITAKTKDGGESTEVSLKIPDDVRPLELVVGRPARLRGSVLDPSGTPIAGATLRVDRQDDRFRYWSNENDAKRSDERGGFEVPLRPGAVEVCALHPNWAPSVKQKIEVRPGAEAGPLTFQLRVGGTITGVALDREGKPAAGREVNMWANESSQDRATDGGGRFRFEHVAPGEVSLQMQPTQAELSATRDDKGQVDWQVAQQSNARVRVEVVDGAVVDVTLGGTPKDGVKVTGVVRGTAPIPRAKVAFYGPTDSKHTDSRAVMADEAGRYEVRLDQPGQYSVSLERDAGAYLNTQVDIPAGPTFVLDITLPSNSISGRVFDAKGEPVNDVRVYAYASSKPQEKEGFNGIYSSQAKTNKDGTFTLPSLSAATYTVSASEDWGYGGSRRGMGQATATGVVLEDGRSVEGVVLRFPVTGTVTGRIRTRDGSPAAEAHVIAQPLDNAALGGIGGGATSGPDGTFRLEGLAVGSYAIYAQGKSNTVTESSDVDVREGATIELNLTLDAANTILASCVDAEGKTMKVGFDIRDARGRSRSVFYYGDEQETPPPEGTRRYSHLPDGDYTVTVRRKKGDPVEQRVSLKGGVVREVRVQIPE